MILSVCFCVCGFFFGFFITSKCMFMHDRSRFKTLELHTTSNREEYTTETLNQYCKYWWVCFCFIIDDSVCAFFLMDLFWSKFSWINFYRRSKQNTKYIKFLPDQWLGRKREFTKSRYYAMYARRIFR